MKTPILCILTRGSLRKAVQGRYFSVYSRVMKSESILEEEGDELKGMKGRIMETFSWLSDVAPSFPVDGSKISWKLSEIGRFYSVPFCSSWNFLQKRIEINIIHEPAVFYETLVEKCKRAEKRITITSLYLGTGKLEGELVKSIKSSMKSTNGNVKINILLDFMRGSRGKINSRTMLMPLLEENSNENCKLFFYHTPQLRGLIKALIPHRFNELIGLQHMKVYIFDNSLIISGANLSNDYFTNRQDRYFVIEDCKELCDFYDELVRRVSEFSFRLMHGNVMFYDAESLYHPLHSDYQSFTEAIHDRIESLCLGAMNPSTTAGSDTRIYPLIQMGQFGIYQDSKVTLHLLKTASPDALLRIATSYFNLTSEYQEALLEQCQGFCEILTAHPTANGFFGAKGVAGGIPAAYTRIEKSFYDKIERRGLHDRIKLREFTRSGWTYHAKGLWYTLPNHRRPSLTLIGSSNFGYRSVRRDLESQIALVTENKKLQDALEQEHNRLYQRSEAVTSQTFNKPDRIPPNWVCAVATLFRYYF